MLTLQGFHLNPMLEIIFCYVSDAIARHWTGHDKTHNGTVEKQVEQSLCLQLEMLFNPPVRTDRWIWCYT